MKFILFEDTQAQADLLLAALKNQIRSTTDIVLRFEARPNDGASSVDQRLYETRLQEVLLTDVYKDANLIIADRDLSTTGTFTGLSEPAL